MYTKQIVFYCMAIAKTAIAKSVCVWLSEWTRTSSTSRAIQTLTVIFLCALTSTVQDVLCVLTKRRSFRVITVLMTYS